MNHQFLPHTLSSFLILFSVVLVACTLASCTYYVPAKLYVNRAGDSLLVALNPGSSARWDSQKDSVVLECGKCDPGYNRMVERFDQHNDAVYEVSPTEDLVLTLYSMGKKDSVIVLHGSAIARTDTAPAPLSRFYARRARPSTTTTETTAAPQKKVATKKITQLKVIAPEGIAIYKDKTKKEVLKILPQGTILGLLSREGEIYSVSVDGGEGFVEAEAVQIIQ
ncbi:MAG: hypothetical protein Q8922_12195 [Bacteroidota bacterium]|nr:hypothetical protein [Bacteroidota bacterium]MDP4233724.1 hypothetical protein [Bacteroidota bacterium]MDP4242363.1 hypothetical protein [Bacteroidota bacterium]MDP4288684.1 hypothetical protein [Bacteroidota bacterium]